jgi:adenylosuccinate synthase
VPDTPTLFEVEPVYETLAGWRLPGRVDRPADLPWPARAFVDRLAALVDVPVTMVGFGPNREDLLTLGSHEALGLGR